MKVILLAEDDAGVRKGIGRTLAEAGFGVDEVGDGAAAIERLGAGTYDLLITDLRLPNADGHQVLTSARTQHPDMPVTPGTTSTG